MMILEEIALYLKNKGLISYDPTGITGDTFLLTMPDQPNNAVALYQYGGGEPDAKTAFDMSAIQIAVRGGKDPRPPFQRAQSIYDNLQSFHGHFVENGHLIIDCQSPNGGVIGTGKDANGRHEFRINFYVHYQNVNSVHREVI